MPEETQNSVGRPATEFYKKRGKRKAVMIQWPEEIINYVDEKEGKGKRTEWLIKAAEEQIARERAAKAREQKS